MDRRDFFRTFVITPLLTPFLGTSLSSGDNVLYLIDDNPESILPYLLKETKKSVFVSGLRYSIRNHHPQNEALQQALLESGWRPASSLENASLVLSFRPMRKPAAPSFVLVSSGKIRDLRSSRLYSLWKERNTNYPPSARLTVLSFQAGSPGLPKGKSAFVYMDGDKVEELSMKKDQERTFKAHGKFVSIKLQNGKIWVADSSCPQKICCSAYPVSAAGERIICAPNRFLLEVSGPSPVDTTIG
jgi:hypothetical protein